LALLCELGGNCGVGIDPSSVSGGVQSKAADKLTFIRDYYSERYAEHHGDLICCRHTLEHIHNTAEFISSIRRAIGNSKTETFFEVPDVPEFCVRLHSGIFTMNTAPTSILGPLHGYFATLDLR